jgi:hypothetical protein
MTDADLTGVNGKQDLCSHRMAEGFEKIAGFLQWFHLYTHIQKSEYIILHIQEYEYDVCHLSRGKSAAGIQTDWEDKGEKSWR